MRHPVQRPSAEHLLKHRFFKQAAKHPEQVTLPALSFDSSGSAPQAWERRAPVRHMHNVYAELVKEDCKICALFFWLD